MKEGGDKPRLWRRGGVEALTLKGFEKKVEMNSRKHVVKAIDGRAEFGRSKSGKMLLRIRVTAEVDGVRSEFEITFGRYGRDNAALGRTYARADAPGGGVADAKRFSALIKALTGREPKVYRMKDGKIKYRMLRGASGGLHALYRARRRRCKVAGGDGPPVAL